MLRSLSNLYLRLTGWRLVGEPPEHAHFVLIAAPHTSNWDLAFSLALAGSRGVRVHWLGKHTLFRGPLRPFMRAIGGIPIVRGQSQGFVEQAADMFKRTDRLVLMVPAEGTRSKVEYWKSGFFRIAEAAQVPIVLGYLDFRAKVGGFGPVVSAGQGPRAAMDVVRAFYSDKVGLYPELFGNPRLRDEDADIDPGAGS